MFRVAISTAPDPQGSGRVGVLTHLHTKAACTARVVTGTAGSDSSRCRYHEIEGYARHTSERCIANAIYWVKSTHYVYVVHGSVVS